MSGLSTRDSRSAARPHNRRRAAGALLLASTLALAACASGDDPGDATATDPDGQIELTMMNHSRGQEAVLNELAAQYEQETGIKVTVDTPGPADYIARLQARTQSGNVPDLFTAVAPSDMAPYYRAGWALDLRSELDSGWSDNFIPTVLALSTFHDGNNLGVEEGVYAAYWDIGTYGFFVDPEKTGIDADDPPATMQDLIDQLAAQGGDNFSVAASLTPMLLQSYASNYMTDQEIEDTLSGAAEWTTDAWRSTFQLLVDMRDAGVIASNSLPGGDDDNPQVERSFFNVRDIGAIIDGSWATAVAAQTAPDFTDYATIVIPPAVDGTHDARAYAIAGRGAAVNAKGEHTEEALAFLTWLTDPDQQQAFMDGAGTLPTSPELLASGGVSPQVASLAAGLDSVQLVSSQFTTDVTSAIERGAQSLVLGEKTVDQVLSEVQTAQDRSR